MHKDLYSADMKVGITGSHGRMGSLLAIAVRARKGFNFVGDIDREDDPEPIFEQADLVIDFSAVEATRSYIPLARKHKTALVIGTTGLTKKDEKLIQDASQDIPILYAANMSIGVNLLLALVEQAAARLEESTFDLEIVETHHKHKVDAPSGTALALGKAAAKGRKVDFENRKVEARYGVTGERSTGSIGFATMRGGSVIGEHMVRFLSEDEHLELTHKAQDRSLFVNGAIKGAAWLFKQPPGLYSMRDFLGL